MIKIIKIKTIREISYAEWETMEFFKGINSFLRRDIYPMRIIILHTLKKKGSLRTLDTRAGKDVNRLQGIHHKEQLGIMIILIFIIPDDI